MNKKTYQVEYGYEPHVSRSKGTLIFYDSFEHVMPYEIDQAVQYAKDHAFAKLVLYPLHEETVRRMEKDPVRPYHRRVDQIQDWRSERELPFVTVEMLEGKRKKYTPIDTALRHIAEIYPSPLFLYLTPHMANKFAAFTSFPEWIVKLRLVLSEVPDDLHPNLNQFRHRWSIATEPKAEGE